MKGMQKAVERIYSAVINKEKILVFGDFDADGVTATALIHEFLSRVDARASWYVPHRIKEGYGLLPAHIQMAADQAVDLIITVDCGISSAEAVAAAAAEDMDVIITDHHEPGPLLPQALAILDPKQPDCPSGLSFLAGVGVAFFLVMGAAQILPGKKTLGNLFRTATGAVSGSVCHGHHRRHGAADQRKPGVEHGRYPSDADKRPARYSGPGKSRPH